MRKVKIAIYYLAKAIGLFRLARYLTRRKLRILCYHGISVDREHEFFDKLFMAYPTYEKRMRQLKKMGLPVIGLEQAVEQLYKDELPDYATVITFDDGWSGVAGDCQQLMTELNFPWTLYVASYYMQKQTQVFNIVVQYIIGNATVPSPDFGDHPIFQAIDIHKDRYSQILALANQKMKAEERQSALEYLAQAYGTDIKWILETNAFAYITEAECMRLAKENVDIQLHTHRHVFPPADLEQSQNEILENQQVLKNITGNTALHFCYPSGIYHSDQFELMQRTGIRSATTVNQGLNDQESHPYELTRFLDGEFVSPIEFEAEISGVADFLRRILK